MAFASYAHKYHEHGISVLPCEGKVAVFKEWQQYCLQQPTDEDIESWSKSFASHNLAMVFGEKFIGLDIDIDDPDFTSELFRIIPRSMCMKVGNTGMTGIYRNDGITGTRRLKLNKNFTVVEILRNNYTVLPPSIHPDTKQPYYWSGMDILNCDFDLLPSLNNSDIEKIEKLIKIYFKDFESTGIEVHGRNNNLFSAGCKKIRQGERSLQSLAEYLYAVDQTENESDPYFLDKKEKFKSKPGIDRAIEFSDRLLKTYVPKEDAKKEETKENGFYFRVEKEDGRISMQPDYYGLADYIINEIGFKSRDNYSWIYEDNYYRSIGTQEIHKLILRLTNSQARPNHLIGFMTILLAKSQIPKKDEPLRYLNFKNGMFDLTNRKIVPHDKNIFSRYALPFNYDEKATCPKFDAFLEKTFGNPAVSSLVEEIFGACLDGSHNKWQKAFFFTGAEQSSKSTIIKVLVKMLGSRNCTSVALDRLSDQYSIQTLDGKLANILEEIPDKPVDAQIFKSVTSEGEILVSAKFKDPYQLKITAKFVSASNGFPKFTSGNYSGALTRRIIAVPCDRQISDDERIVAFENTFDDEMSGIFNKALAGLLRLEARGSFPMIDAVEAKREELTKEIDSVHEWLDEHMEIDDTHIQSKTLREIYISYASETKQDGGFPVKKMEFFKRFRRYLSKRVTEKKIDDYMYKLGNRLSIRRVKFIDISDCRDFANFT